MQYHLLFRSKYQVQSIANSALSQWSVTELDKVTLSAELCRHACVDVCGEGRELKYWSSCQASEQRIRLQS